MPLGANSAAATLRSFILKELGGKCVDCGTHKNLHCDLLVGSGRAHHRMNFLRRQQFYFVQLQRKNLELRCGDCHIIKTRERRLWERAARACGLA